VIVEAGIMGCAAAYYLARVDASVVLLDKGGVAGQQSSRAWGFVRVQARRVQARDPAEIPPMLKSLRMWRGLEGEPDADMGWREGGCLCLAHDQREA
jgi:glycine/D-amino acid oxidase-like deaminating enzyme